MSRSLKKIITGTFVFVIALGISFVAYAQEINFTNSLSSDIVSIDKIFEDETSFAGIVEDAAVEITSEKFDAGFEIEVSLGTGSGNEVSLTDHLNLAWTYLDYHLEFRPIEILTIAFHNDLWTEGSYLPLWDDNTHSGGNVPAGGLGSSGVTLMVAPIEGLRISATTPIKALEEGKEGNFFNGSGDDGENEKFNIGFGADYTFEELFSIGAKVGDVIDSDKIFFGVFGTVQPFQSEDLIIRAGFSHYNDIAEMESIDYSENVTITGKNVYNLVVEFNAENFSIVAEMLGDTSVDNEDDDETPYDMYIGASFSYSINENLSIALGGQCFFDFANDENAKPLFGLAPSISYALKNHEFSAGAAIEFCDGNVYAKFPLSWTCSF